MKRISDMSDREKSALRLELQQQDLKLEQKQRELNAAMKKLNSDLEKIAERRRHIDHALRDLHD